jgi:hypothetical protein
LETFAQLITHVISKELSDEHCDIFEKLKKGQSDVYTRYNDYVIACDKNYLLNFFLNPRPINIENVIDFIKIDYDIKNINPEEFIPWHWESLLLIFRNLDIENSIYSDKILCPIVIQKLIDKNPKTMMFDLKSGWNYLKERFKQLEYPKEDKKDSDMISDLEGIGQI